MNDKELRTLKKWASGLLKENYDKFDIESEIDNQISLEENQDILREKFRMFNVQEKVSKKEQKAEQERLIEMERKNAEKVIREAVVEANRNVVCKSKEIKKYYNRLRKSAELVVKGYINSCYLESRSGLGKSFQLVSILNELEADYIIFAGDITPAYLYRFLYENNGKIIVFRDLAKLLTELRSIDLLKAITETLGERIVSKATYSKEQKDLPPYFICRSRFIFEFNDLKYNGLKEDIMALFTRGDYYYLSFSFEEIADIMRQICKNEQEKEITEFLLKHYNFVGINHLNLRTQQKAFRIYEYATKEGKNWKQELKEFLKSEITPIRRQLYSLIGERAVKTTELKRLLVMGGTDGVYHLRTADRRIYEWILRKELFVVGYVCNDDEEMERYLLSHKNYYVSLNPIEKLEYDTHDIKPSQDLKCPK